MPPPISKIISLRVVPIGTSTNPVFFTFPASANILVPLPFFVPSCLYHSEPSERITGILANVSTLLILVGLFHNPEFAGKGGRGRGIPLLPSMEAIKAVSSPQTKAPAPILISRSKLNSVPRILFPSKFNSLACAIAFLRWATAIGYSART